jgi:hypothetical protein
MLFCLKSDRFEIFMVASLLDWSCLIRWDFSCGRLSCYLGPLGSLGSWALFKHSKKDLFGILKNWIFNFLSPSLSIFSHYGPSVSFFGQIFSLFRNGFLPNSTRFLIYFILLLTNCH